MILGIYKLYEVICSNWVKVHSQGTLPNQQEIAVKRLSRNSQQGAQELRMMSYW